MSVIVPAESRRGSGSSAAAVTDGLEVPDVGAGNCASVLCESSVLDFYCCGETS